MRVTVILLAVATVHALSPQAAEAGWFGEFLHRMHYDWHRNNAWPEPFVYEDRQVVNKPLIAMVERGWQSQNTLGDHFFDRETQALTQAGLLKVRWIATQAPVRRRTVFVLRGPNESATSARMDAVRDAAAGFRHQQGPAEVLLTDRDPVGGAGDYLDEVSRQLRSSVPLPRLPDRSGIVTGDGGGL